MSLGIKKFCPYTDTECTYRSSWEVDGVDENGCHTIWIEHECNAPGDGCVKEGDE